MTEEEALRAVVDAIPEKYKSVLAEMLARALEEARSRDEAIDTCEGSVIYSALAPVAFEIAQLHARIGAAMNEAFADTASRPFLIRRAFETGTEPYPATHAVLAAHFNVAVDIGARFSFRSLTYEVIDEIPNRVYHYLIRCEQRGARGNIPPRSELVPINYIEGLNKAEVLDETGYPNAHILIPGKDEEDTEVFRNRYISTLVGNAFGGNIQHYKNLVIGMDGVGAVKVFPADPEAGNVLLMILDANYANPSANLIAAVWSQIDPETFEDVNGHTGGLGLGKAPIGHKVTVSGPQALSVNVKIDLPQGSSMSLTAARNAAEEYFKSVISESWGSADDPADFAKSVWLRQTGLNVFLTSVANTVTFNGESDLDLANPKAVPVLGTLEIIT